MAHALPARIPFADVKSDRDLQVRIAAGVGVLALGVAASDDEGTILCPFRRCTAGYCPLCGATRSFGRLLRGDVAGAWARHPFVVLLAVQVIILGGLLAFSGQRSGTLLTPTRRRWILGANGIVVIALWAGRLIAGDVPRPSTLTWPIG